MSLEALAPDQRAVVQLVLQQGRSFAELAGLLAISEDAVRDRAHRGLAALTPAAEGLDADEQAEVADFLLGQGSPSAREATRSLLRTAPEANAWATAVAAELASLPGARLPDVPPGRATRGRPAAAAPAAASEPAPAAGTPEPDTVVAAEPEPAAAEPPVRARPRPRPARAVPGGAAAAATATGSADADAAPAGEPVSSDRGAAPRSSRLGGMLLIAAVAIVVVAGIVFLIGRGNGDGGTDSASTPSATSTAASPTATATADSRYQPLGQITLTGVQGSKAKGAMVLYQDAKTNTLTFTVEGTGLQPNTNADAYAVWLVGKGRATRLGYNRDSPVTSNGVLQVGNGTAAAASKRFTCRLAVAQSVVVSLETRQGSVPQNPVLTGKVPETGLKTCK